MMGKVPRSFSTFAAPATYLHFQNLSNKISLVTTTLSPHLGIFRCDVMDVDKEIRLVKIAAAPHMYTHTEYLYLKYCFTSQSQIARKCAEQRSVLWLALA